MTLHENLQTLTDQTWGVEPEHWAAATRLAMARTRRGGHTARRDRGDGEFLAHLLGYFGEVWLWSRLASLGGLEDVTEHLADQIVNLRPPRDQRGVDLEAPDLKVDLKGIDASPWKRFFCVNATSHRVHPDTDAYLCFLAVPLGRTISLARLVPYHHVSGWPTFALQKSSGIPDPSHNLRLEDFLASYFTDPPDLNLMRASRFPHRFIQQSAAGDGVDSWMAALKRDTAPRVHVLGAA